MNSGHGSASFVRRSISSLSAARIASMKRRAITRSSRGSRARVPRSVSRSWSLSSCPRIAAARPLVVELGELGGEGAASPSRRPGSQASRWRGPPESTPGGCSASENLGQPTGGSGSTASVHTLRGTAAARNLDPPPDARAGLRGWVIHPALYIERRCGSARGTSAPEARRRRGRADAPSSTGLKRGSCAPGPSDVDRPVRNSFHRPPSASHSSTSATPTTDHGQSNFARSVNRKPNSRAPRIVISSLVGVKRAVSSAPAAPRSRSPKRALLERACAGAGWGWTARKRSSPLWYL